MTSCDLLPGFIKSVHSLRMCLLFGCHCNGLLRLRQCRPLLLLLPSRVSPFLSLPSFARRADDISLFVFPYTRPQQFAVTNATKLNRATTAELTVTPMPASLLLNPTTTPTATEKIAERDKRTLVHAKSVFHPRTSTMCFSAKASMGSWNRALFWRKSAQSGSL